MKPVSEVDFGRRFWARILGAFLGAYFGRVFGRCFWAVLLGGLAGRGQEHLCQQGCGCTGALYEL